VRGGVLIFALFSALAAAFAAPSACHGAGSVVKGLSGRLEVPDDREPLTWGRDVFVPLIRDASTAELRLMAVFYNPERPSAIINDRLVYEGGTVDGQKVVDIGRSHVILLGEVGEIRLEIAGVPGLTDDREDVPTKR